MSERYVYLAHNILPNVSPSTHINEASDWRSALAAHNDEKRCSGLPRKAAGGWQVLVLIRVPAAEANDAMLEWRGKRRQLQFRIIEGVKMAMRHNWHCEVDRNAVIAKLADRELGPSLQARLLESLQSGENRQFCNDMPVKQPAAEQTAPTVSENAPSNSAKSSDSKPAPKSTTSVLGKRAPEKEESKAKTPVVDVLAIRRSATFSGWANSGAANSSAPLRDVRRNGDLLCSDILAGSTLEKMKAVSGHNDQRCLCGAPRTAHSQHALVRIDHKLPPVSTPICATCGRLAVAYERCTLDSRQLPQAKRSRASGDETLEESLTTSLDICVQKLAISFNLETSGRSLPTTRKSRCRHESLTKVRLSRNDMALVGDMLR